ncbi:hypothetical protein GGF37_004141 [Kickxella alabastrina]|nr:hypothetical protein GGF37_004141 [Kickxella alabastrina]
MEFTPDILEYLRSQLCTLDQDMRSSNLVQNLRIGEDQQVRRQVRRLQSSFVVVSDMRTCPHCLKRIGAGTAFAVIPPQAGIKGAGPSVVHYSCWQRHKSAGMCATGGHDDEDNGDGSSVFSSDEPATPDADDTTKTPSTPGFVIKWA